MEAYESPGREEEVQCDATHRALVNDSARSLAEARIVERIWNRDPSVWKQESEHQKIISNALGWLTVAEATRESVDDLVSFAEEIWREGFAHVVLMGMGGSSLCPEVFRRSLGRVDGYPELLVLDSTVPDSVLSLERRLDPAKTLFIVSSKSGKTTEPQVFFEYFWDRVARSSGTGPGRNFIAITDPGTLLEQIARDRDFRRVFTNPADIGGRYSALSYFGIVPAALAGYDVRQILDRAVKAMASCRLLEGNPGSLLGAGFGSFARLGRNKLTFVIPEPISSLGLWIEQLIAESTGKDGVGILPVAGERLGSPKAYGDDRVFVYLGRKGFSSDDIENKLSALKDAGHPVIVRPVEDPLDLGNEFFTWEFATAVAGSLMGINPFDQPNVQESKDNTERLLAEFEREGRFAEQAPAATQDGIQIYAGGMTSSLIEPGSSPGSIIATHLASIRPGDYAALTAYIEETHDHDRLLDDIRMRIRDRTAVATTVGYGPRFLHSTGQLHKGGPPSGVFIQITADDRKDLAIPGRSYGFSTLKQAQALGDFESLSKRNLRVVRVHLGQETAGGLVKLAELVRNALPI